MNNNKKTILIVDDEPEIRGLMQEILSEEGYLTFSAKNAKEAQRIIADSPPDLVYLDIWLPDIDGITLLKEWSETNQLSFPVIMISGHATIETAVKATRLGAFDVIEKPLSIEKLVASAEKALIAAKKTTGQDLALLFKNNCNAYADTFLDLDVAANTDQILFLNGETGTEKGEFAKYIHYQKHNKEDNFVNIQLNLLAAEKQENKSIIRELENFIDTIKEGTIFLSGYSELIIKDQIQARNTLQNLPLAQGIKFIVGVNFSKKDKKLMQNEELDTIFFDEILLDLPPLRQCLQDIPELLKGFVDYFSITEELMPRRFSLAAQNMLTKYAWPGNIKQLKTWFMQLY